MRKKRKGRQLHLGEKNNTMGLTKERNYRNNCKKKKNEEEDLNQEET